MNTLTYVVLWAGHNQFEAWAAGLLAGGIAAAAALLAHGRYAHRDHYQPIRPNPDDQRAPKPAPPTRPAPRWSAVTVVRVANAARSATCRRVVKP
jgi:hypothetical protein